MRRTLSIRSVRSKVPLPLEYAYFLARTPGFRSYAIANMTGTSGRQRVPKDCFDNYPVVVPSEQIAARFGGMANGIMAMMKQNNEESRTLTQLCVPEAKQLTAGINA